MLTVLVVAALVLAVGALVAGFLALVTLGRLRRGAGVLGRGATGRESLLEASARHAAVAEQAGEDVAALRAEVLALRDRCDQLEAGVRSELAGWHAQFASPDGSLGRAEFEAELTRVLAAERDDRGRHLDQVQERIESDFAAMRAELADLHAELADQTQSERARLAADHSAARDQLRAAADKVEKVIGSALRRVALVRYDAFDDLGGRLSFSLAVLDSRGDGLTLTSLAGREGNRMYAKPISAGTSSAELSPEEQQAIAAALSGATS